MAGPSCRLNECVSDRETSLLASVWYETTLNSEPSSDRSWPREPMSANEELRAEVSVLREELEDSQREVAYWRARAEANAASARREAALVDAAVEQVILQLETALCCLRSQCAYLWLAHSPSEAAQHSSFFNVQARIASESKNTARCSVDKRGTPVAAVRFSCRAEGLPLLGRSAARLVLVGCTESLGGWKVKAGAPLLRNAEGLWVSDLVLLPVGTLISYKCANRLSYGALSASLPSPRNTLRSFRAWSLTALSPAPPNLLQIRPRHRCWEHPLAERRRQHPRRARGGDCARGASRCASGNSPAAVCALHCASQCPPVLSAPRHRSSDTLSPGASSSAYLSGPRRLELG